MRIYKIQANGDPHPIEASGLFVPQVTTVDNLTIESIDSEVTVNVNADAKVISLPKITAANLGMRITVRNIGADGANLVSVSPNALDAIVGTIANAAADSVATGVKDKDMSNTKATANKGDYIVLEAFTHNATLNEGLWAIAGGVGIWAQQA
jgi:hypothetical protein